jgi:hypothetical protein
MSSATSAGFGLAQGRTGRCRRDLPVSVIHEAGRSLARAFYREERKPCTPSGRVAGVTPTNFGPTAYSIIVRKREHLERHGEPILTLRVCIRLGRLSVMKMRGQASGSHVP